MHPSVSATPTYRQLSVNRRRNTPLTPLAESEFMASVLRLPLERAPLPLDAKAFQVPNKAFQTALAESVSNGCESVSSSKQSVSNSPLKAFQTDPIPSGRGERAVLLWLAQRQLANGDIGDTGIATRRLMSIELDMPKETVRTCLYRLMKAGRIEFVCAVWGRRVGSGTAFRVPASVLAATQQFLKAFQESVSTRRSSSFFNLNKKTTTTRELYEIFNKGIVNAGIGDRVSASDCIEIFTSPDRINKAEKPWQGAGAAQVLAAVTHMAAYVKTPQGASVKDPAVWIRSTLIKLGPACVGDSKFSLEQKQAPAKPRAPKTASVPEVDPEYPEVDPEVDPEYQASFERFRASGMSVGEAHLSASNVKAFRIG